MINTDQIEEEYSDTQNSNGSSGFIGMIAYLACLAMPFIIYLIPNF